MKTILLGVLVLFLYSCAKPIPGPKGDTGLQGPTGSIGQTGLQGGPGIPGQNGTTLYTVQFCPGFASTYPTTFPEIGLCIDGKLYAEYYDPPSSGLTYLPDGQYSSTQTSAPCNFSVVACQVQ